MKRDRAEARSSGDRAGAAAARLMQLDRGSQSRLDLALDPALGSALDPPGAPSRLRGLGAAIVGLGAVLGLMLLLTPAPPPPPPFAAFIDPSSATAAELTLLPGIGPVLADRIVDHRENHGPFERPEALLAVPGIGPATLRAIEPWILIEPTPAPRVDESEGASPWPIR